MPPSLLMRSTMISAASRAGTPKTEAGPVRKVAMPMCRLSGLSCAIAVAGSSARAAAIKSCRFMFPPIPSFLPTLCPPGPGCLADRALDNFHDDTKKKPDRLCPSTPLSNAAFSANCDRVDDHLDSTSQACVAEHEEELPGLISHQLAGLHVLEHVDAVLGLQDLMHREGLALGLRRYRFPAPGIGPHGTHAHLGEILRRGDTHPRLRRTEALPIRVFPVQQFHPVRMEEHDIAFANFDALPLGGALHIFCRIGTPLLDHVDAVVTGHVQHHPASNDSGKIVQAELLQTGGVGEVLALQPLV